MVAVRLFETLDPKTLDPLEDLVLRFDKSYICLCDNCRNRKLNGFMYYPCMFRKNFAWKKCKHHEPIARNCFLAEGVVYLTKWLTLDEAIGLVRRDIGELFDPIKEETTR